MEKQEIINKLRYIYDCNRIEEKILTLQDLRFDFETYDYDEMLEVLDNVICDLLDAIDDIHDTLRDLSDIYGIISNKV